LGFLAHKARKNFWEHLPSHGTLQDGTVEFAVAWEKEPEIKSEEGFLVVHLKSAHGLKGVAHGIFTQYKNPRPLVSVTLGDALGENLEHKETNPIRATLDYGEVHPVWKEQVEFHGDAKDFNRSTLHIEIYDGKISAESSMGSCWCELTPETFALLRHISARELVTFTQPLSGQGSLDFALSYQSTQRRAEQREAEADLITSVGHVETDNGFLRVHLRRACDLVVADTGFLQSGKSDPYVRVTAGGHEGKESRVIKKTVNPEWDEWIDFEGDINDFISHPLHLKLFDADLLGEHQSLGELHVPLQLDEIKANGGKDFNEVLPTRGSIEFGVTWIHKKMHAVLHVARLRVHLHKAIGLRPSALDDPEVQVLVSAGGRTAHSKIVPCTPIPHARSELVADFRNDVFIEGELVTFTKHPELKLSVCEGPTELGTVHVDLSFFRKEHYYKKFSERLSSIGTIDFAVHFENEETE